MPVPVGAELFDQDPNVTAQLHNGAGKCWTSSFTSGSTTVNTAEQFKAKTP